MADIKGPGQSGSTQGQIKTPMMSQNVANKGGEKVHSFKSTMNLDAAGPSKGALKTDSKIEGPGVTCNWDTQKTIKGSNLKGKY